MELLGLALILDYFIGEPDALWRRVPHPVVLIGRLIDWFDQKRDNLDLAGRFNLSKDRFELWIGGLLVLAFLVMSLAVSWLVHQLMFPFGWLLELAIVTILLAQKSLITHVQAVADGLLDDGLDGGRHAVSMIVGRDVSQLDESGIAKAAIESLAENASDGVIAPALWYAIAGLPGIVFYKAINTADSMVGHRTERHEYFGKPAALMDDLLNWPAARLTALLVVTVAAFRKGRDKASIIWKITRQDAPYHRSPNAGWPETAFAAYLGLTLGGPRRYGDEFVDARVLNEEGRDQLTLDDISRALVLFNWCCAVLIVLCVLIFFFEV